MMELINELINDFVIFMGTPNNAPINYMVGSFPILYMALSLHSDTLKHFFQEQFIKKIRREIIANKGYFDFNGKRFEVYELIEFLPNEDYPKITWF